MKEEREKGDRWRRRGRKWIGGRGEEDREKRKRRNRKKGGKLDIGHTQMREGRREIERN